MEWTTFTYSSGRLDVSKDAFIGLVEEKQNKCLEERHLEFLVSMREDGLQNTVAQRRLPLELSSTVLVKVEQLKSLQVLHHL